MKVDGFAAIIIACLLMIAVLLFMVAWCHLALLSLRTLKLRQMLQKSHTVKFNALSTWPPRRTFAIFEDSDVRREVLTDSRYAPVLERMRRSLRSTTAEWALAGFLVVVSLAVVLVVASIRKYEPLAFLALFFPAGIFILKTIHREKLHRLSLIANLPETKRITAAHEGGVT